MGTVTVIELTGDERKLAKALTKAENEIAKLQNSLHSAGAGATASGIEVNKAMEMIEAANTKTLKALQRSLQGLGPEGKAAADALKQHMSTSAAGSANSIDAILGKIREINPEAAAAANAAQSSIQQEMAEAARFSEREFKRPLDELRKMGPEGKAAAEAIRRNLVASGKIAEKSMEDVLSEIEKMDTAAAQAGRALKHDVAGGAEEVGDKLSDNNRLVSRGADLVLEYAAKYGTVAAALAGIRKLWQQINEEKRAGLEQLEKTQNQDRRLMQVSTSLEEFQGLKTQSSLMSQQFGIDAETVKSVMFSGISEGFQEAVPKILRSVDVVDPLAAAGMAGQIPKLYEKDNLSSMQAISGVLTAAKESRVDFETLGAAMGKVAEGGGVLGSNFAQDAAVMSVLANEFKSADTASDRIKGFATQANVRGGFENMNLLDVVSQVEAMTEEDRKKFLGDSQELNVAYSKILNNRNEILAIEEKIKRDLQATASGGGLLESRTQDAARDPETASIRAKLIAGAQLAATQRDFDAISGAKAAGATSQATNYLRQEDGVINRTIGGMMAGTISSLGESLGLNQDQSAAFTVGAVRSIGQGVIGIPAAFQSSGQIQINQASSIDKVAATLQSIEEKMERTAKTNETMAAQETRPRPVTPSLSTPP